MEGYACTGESFGSYDTLKAAQAACIKFGEVKCGDMYVYNRNCDGKGGFSICKSFKDMKYSFSGPGCVFNLWGTGPDNTTPQPLPLTGAMSPLVLQVGYDMRRAVL